MSFIFSIAAYALATVSQARPLSQPVPHSVRSPLSACSTETRPVTKVRLDDGRAAYIEPMAFARGARYHLLAGEPTYAWMPGSPPLLDTTAALLGAVFMPAGIAGLPKPQVKGTVTFVRLLAEADEYAAVFAETDGTWAGRREPTVLGYWFGRTDGATWRTLERLPLPAAGTLNPRDASRLVRIGDTFLIAVPYVSDAGSGVAVYTRAAAGWSADGIPVRGVAYIALTARAGRPVLYVVRPDSTRLPDSNSLSLFVRVSGSWRDRGFLVRGGVRPVHQPTVLVRGGMQTLSWREEDDASGSRSARMAPILEDGTLGAIVTIARDIDDVMVVHDPTDAFRWVVSRTSADGTGTLALVEWTTGEPRLRDVVADPFTGPALAHSVDGGEVIAGPIMGRSPGEEPVVTGILRFARRCPIGAAGGTP